MTADPLAEFLLPLLPYSDIPEAFHAESIAAELREHYRIVPIEQVGHEARSRDHLGCQHELNYSHPADDACPLEGT